MSTRRTVLVLLAALGLIALPVWVMASQPAQEQVSDNLLVDGDFEAPPTWPQQDGVGEVQVAPGWRAYYLDAPPPYVEASDNCADHPRLYDCFWMRPEFRDSTSFAHRVHSGERSQKYFSFGRMHEAGLYQQVYTIPIGVRLRFSIWMQAWMCANPDACGVGGIRSDEPSDMHLRVGIDPLGGTDPFTPSVVWSAEQPAWDKFVLFQVETTALSETVTVLTHSRADWPWPRMNNDVYLDDAALVIVGAYATVTPVVSLGIVNPTPTPFPEGAVTHTVQMGETLFDIALKYHLRAEDLIGLNGITTLTQLYVGQPIVIEYRPVEETPAPRPTITLAPKSTPRPTATHLPTLTPTVFATPTPVVSNQPSVLPLIAIGAAGLSVMMAVVGVLVWLAYRQGMAKSQATRNKPRA